MRFRTGILFVLVVVAILVPFGVRALHVFAPALANDRYYSALGYSYFVGVAAYLVWPYRVKVHVSVPWALTGLLVLGELVVLAIKPAVFPIAVFPVVLGVLGALAVGSAILHHVHSGELEQEPVSLVFTDEEEISDT
jgi:hypothetical protein